MGNVIQLPVRLNPRPTDPVSAHIGLISARLLYLACEVRCIAAHASEPVDALTLAEWMEDQAADFGEHALGDTGDGEGGG